MTHGPTPDSPPRTLQALSPASARFCLDAERFVTRELGVDVAGRTVVVGLSGGADSTALLLTLHYLVPRLSITLRAAHLDHGLRPESAAEAEHARALCDALDVPIDVERVDVGALARERSTGLEEAGREARYAFFDRVRSGLGETGTIIALAHTLNDLAEDVLMRLLRGTGWPALGGMAGYEPERNLLRPLLLTSRDAIETFVASCGQGWVDDPSNRDPAFLRNRLRHDILPRFLDENPNFLDTVATLWRTASTDAAYFDGILGSIFNSEEKQCDGRISRKVLTHFSKNEVRLKRTELSHIPPAIRLRMFKKALESLGNGQPLASALRGLDEAFSAGSVGRVFQFPGAKTARIESDCIVFSGPGDGT